MTGSNDKQGKVEEAEAETQPLAEPPTAEAGDAHDDESDDREHEAATPGNGKAPPPPPTATRGARSASPGWRGAPPWVVPLYVVGLVLVFAGQRALSALETGATVLTATGVLAVLMATLVRFSPKFRAAGERGSIEALLKILSVLGLVALGLYAVTTEWGQDRFGLASQDLESRERLLGVLNVLWLALLLIATVPMLFAEASLRPMRRAERPESRRVRAAAAAGLTLVLAAVYGSLFVFSADAADVKVDYSYFKTSGPSESTLKMAQSLQDQVRVTAFFPDVNEVKTEVVGYLNELSRAAPKLKVEVTDRLLEPKKARDLRATQDGMIVLSKGKVTRSVVVGTELDAARAKLKTLDRDLQAELLKLARSRRTVYMTVGHGELNDKGNTSGEGRSSRILDELLRKQNYTVKDLGIAQGLANEVPADADVVMVLGPAEPFAPEEVATLKRWVLAGGKLLLALDPDVIASTDVVRLSPAEASSATGKEQPPAPSASAKATGSTADQPVAASSDTSASASAQGALGFEPLLKALGLSYSPIVLANENKHVRRRFNDSDRVMLVTSSFSSHASVSTLSRNAPRAAIVASGAGSLEPIEKVATKRPQNIDFAVRAEADTFADADRNYRRDKEKEPAKSYTLAAAVSQKLSKDGAKAAKKADKNEKGDAKAKGSDKDPLDDLNEMRAFVLSDADALSDLVLANVPGNQFLFVDAVRWLGGEESWSGQQTTEEDVRIEHTKKEDQVWFYSTIFGVPALVLGAGLFVSRRARQKHNKKGNKK